MTLSTVEPDIYDAPSTPDQATDQDRLPLSALPKIVWVSGAMLVANVVVGLGIWLTPNLMTDPFGREVAAYEASAPKPSPTTPVVDTTRHKVRLAAKVRPVIVVEEPVVADAYLGSGQDAVQLDIPVRTASALYQGEGGADTLEMRRATYVSHNAADVAPRRASERDNKFVVIN